MIHHTYIRGAFHSQKSRTPLAKNPFVFKKNPSKIRLNPFVLKKSRTLFPMSEVPLAYISHKYLSLTLFVVVFLFNVFVPNLLQVQLREGYEKRKKKLEKHKWMLDKMYQRSQAYETATGR